MNVAITSTRRVLRHRIGKHTIGQWTAIAAAWTPPVAVLSIALRYIAGGITRAQAMHVGWNEIPGLYLWMAMLWCTPLTTMTGRSLAVQRKHFGLAFTTLAFSNLIAFALRRPATAFGRPFAILGVCAVTLVLPLAITSKLSIRRRLGPRRWKQLHRLVYPITLVLIIHLWLVPTTDGHGGALSGTIILGLALALRLSPFKERLYRIRRRISLRSP